MACGCSQLPGSVATQPQAVERFDRAFDEFWPAGMPGPIGYTFLGAWFERSRARELLAPGRERSAAPAARPGGVLVERCLPGSETVAFGIGLGVSQAAAYMLDTGDPTVYQTMRVLFLWGASVFAGNCSDLGRTRYPGECCGGCDIFFDDFVHTDDGWKARFQCECTKCMDFNPDLLDLPDEDGEDEDAGGDTVWPARGEFGPRLRSSPMPSTTRGT